MKYGGIRKEPAPGGTRRARAGMRQRARDRGSGACGAAEEL